MLARGAAVFARGIVKETGQCCIFSNIRTALKDDVFTMSDLYFTMESYIKAR